MDLDSLSSFTLVGTMDTKDNDCLPILCTQPTALAGDAFSCLCGALDSGEAMNFSE